MHAHIFGPNFQEKQSFVVIFKFNYLFIYLYLQTKPITVFQGIILRTDVVIAF